MVLRVTVAAHIVIEKMVYVCGKRVNKLMNQACQDEISTLPGKTDFTLQLHMEIKFCQQLLISS